MSIWFRTGSGGRCSRVPAGREWKSKNWFHGKKPLKEKPAQKEAEDAKTQQGVQEDDTELTVEDLD